MTAKSDNWKVGGGLTVFILIAIPLWQEFSEPGQIGWNVFLGALSTGLVGLALFLNRYFAAHADEIGEARFDTRNAGDRHG